MVIDGGRDGANPLDDGGTVLRVSTAHGTDTHRGIGIGGCDLGIPKYSYRNIRGGVSVI